MNRYLRYLLPMIAIGFFLSAGAVDTSAQVIREIMKRMDENNKGLKSLKSKIHLAKTDTVLNETDYKEGEVSYLPGRSEKQIYVRINWAKPEESLAIANGSYVLYVPRRKQAIVGKVDSVKGKNAGAGGVLAFMTMSKAQLSANYDVKYVGEETVKSGVKTWHLLLTPKTATNFKTADLWVDSNGMPVQAKIVEKNNDTTTILLSGIQRNPTLNAGIFKLTPPKGTQIVQS
ncbi:MAG TPA: outer-membrane lipoprotein carrier protein LolA [Pyrinomonadaceae bacterium]|nr:outer-membrane lipoprotein carrier protein LolA [Pyrinomonadaceae bacterium]